MKTSKESFVQLQRFKPMFGALSDFLDDFPTFESLDNAVREAEDRLKKKREEEAAIDKRLAEVAAAERRVEEQRNEDVKALLEHKQSFTLEGEKIIHQAQNEAASIKAKAENEAKAIAKPYEQRRDAIIIEINDLIAKRDATKGDLVHIQNSVKQHGDKLVAIQKSITNIVGSVQPPAA